MQPHLDEYRKHFEKDAALARRFQSVQVNEPSLPHTINILKGLRDRYEAHHKVSITDGAIVAAASLSDRYVTDRFLPDKAIDLASMRPERDFAYRFFLRLQNFVKLKSASLVFALRRKRLLKARTSN